MNQYGVLGPLPARVRPHRRPDAARPVPRLHGRRAHPDGGAQPAPLHDAGARARIPAVQPADERLRAARGAVRRGALPRHRQGPRRRPFARSARATRGASAATHGLSREDAELVAWLVEQHLVMSSTAQKQDIVRPRRRSRAFAERVGDRAPPGRALPADGGRHPRHQPEGLERVERQAARGPVPRHARAAGRRAAWRATRELQSAPGRSAGDCCACTRCPTARTRQLWAQLDTAYFLRHDAAGDRLAARCCTTASTRDKPVVKARLSRRRRRPAGDGLHARPEGAVRAHLRLSSSASSFNILEAKIHTTRARLRARHLPGHGPGRATRTTATCISYDRARAARRADCAEAPLGPPRERPPVAPRARTSRSRPRCDIRPDDEAPYHVLSIVAGDRPGLLYAHRARADALRHQPAHARKINTLGERAEDVFLVSGETLANPKKVLQLEQELLEASCRDCPEAALAALPGCAASAPRGRRRRWRGPSRPMPSSVCFQSLAVPAQRLDDGLRDHQVAVPLGVRRHDDPGRVRRRGHWKSRPRRPRCSRPSTRALSSRSD